MSDDTATVERLKAHLEKLERGGYSTITWNAPDIALLLNLIEQHARTIAELREHKSESEDIIASLRHDLANPPGDVQELVLKTLGLWPCPFDMKAQLAEQAARLEQARDALEQIVVDLNAPEITDAQANEYANKIATEALAAIDGAKG